MKPYGTDHLYLSLPRKQENAGAGEDKDYHKTISSRITVYYPFHALHGCELELVCRPRKGGNAVTVVDPEGFRLKIPEWMVSPQAAQYRLSERAEISSAALFCIVNLLKSITDK